MGLIARFDIPKVRFKEPERNLPGRNPRVTTPETRFTIQFAKAYLQQNSTIHHKTNKNEVAFARQIAINGFGIADLVSVSWKSFGQRRLEIDDFLNGIRPTVRAFEIKLNNWRKGMIQAHRYRYFANAAILVLPKKRSEIAVTYLNSFRKIQVGLWAFDTITGRIFPYYTPYPRSPVIPEYWKRAIQIAARTTRVLPILQTP